MLTLLVASILVPLGIAALCAVRENDFDGWGF